MGWHLEDSDAVRRLIEELYEVFDEPNDLLTSGWYSEDREAIVKEAVRYDRRALPPHVIHDLPYYLITTVGGAQTLRHYLPRIFEEELLFGGVDLEWDFLAYKLRMADFIKWPLRQRQLVLAGVRLWLAQTIMRTESVREKDFPELAVEALLERTSIVTLLEMIDPDIGRDGEVMPTEVAFLIAAERSLLER
jgi:hypothetical protein